MDAVAFLLLIVAICVYFLSRKKSEVGIRWAIFIGGAGAGLLAGSIWAMQIVNSVFP